MDYQNIPFTDFGGDGDVLHFAHANGFPAKTYRQFLEPLTANYRIIAIDKRPLWKAPEKDGYQIKWESFADDLIQLLDSHSAKSIYGVGHSMGAVATLLASIKRPDLFKAIVLIDPVFLPTAYTLAMQLTPDRYKSKFPFIRKALNRPDCWDTRQEAFDFHRDKRVFRRINDSVLWDYINEGTKETDDGKITLSYSKQWEAHCYASAPYIWDLLKECHVPVLGIRAGLSDTLLSVAWKRWKQYQPHHQFLEMPNVGHLVPFETPSELAKNIHQFCSGYF
jgi:pimeloyl-ACP methyl ester carboxylesterase